MSVIVRDLVEYIGLADYIPMDVTDINNIEIDTFITLPPEKPDIKQISRVSIKSSIENGRVVKSTKGKSLDGCITKGFKYVGTLKVLWRIDYIANNHDNTLFSINGECFKSSYVSFPYQNKLACSLTPSIFVNDIDVQLLSQKSLILNVNGILMIEDN